jgi:hypothetical protein
MSPRACGGALLAALVLGRGIPAQAQASPSEWRWSVVPFVWLSNLGGLSVVGERQVTVGDSALTPAAAFRLEAQRRRVGFRVSGTWAALANRGTIAPVTQPMQGEPGQYDFSWATVEAHGMLQVGPYDPASSFTVYLGLRAVRQTQRLQDASGGAVAVTQVWLEPVEGSRYSVTVGRRLWATIGGDIGGFAVGSDFTWTLSGELAYRLAPPLALALRYTYREVQYDNKEDGPETYRWDAGVQQGWFFGAVLAFPSAIRRP